MSVVLNIEDVYIENEATFKVGNTAIKWIYEYDDLGKAPEQVDFTPITSKVAKKKDGVIDIDAWTFKYYKNKDDYDTIQAAITAGTSVALSFEFEDGDTIATTGLIVNQYKTGGSSNSQQAFVVTCQLDDKFTLTHAA